MNHNLFAELEFKGIRNIVLCLEYNQHLLHVNCASLH